jgi:hypothetical protein
MSERITVFLGLDATVANSMDSAPMLHGVLRDRMPRVGEGDNPAARSYFQIHDTWDRYRWQHRYIRRDTYQQ